MKVLDVSELESAISKLKQSLKEKREQAENTGTAAYDFVHTHTYFSGQGADAIRSFYSDAHLPFLRFFENFIDEYTRFLDNMKNALEEVEPSSDGFIHQQFLEGELTAGLNKTKNTTIQLTDEANAIMASVHDIVSLPRIDDHYFVQQVRNAEKDIETSIEKLVKFDQEQTKELSYIEHDIEIMKNYVSTIQSMFQGKKISINAYKSGQLDDIADYKKLTTELSAEETGKTAFSFLDFFADINQQMSTGDNILVGSQVLKLGVTAWWSRHLEINYLGGKPSLWNRLKGDYRFTVRAPESWTAKTGYSSKVAKWLKDFKGRTPSNALMKQLHRWVSTYNTPSHLLKHLAGFPKNASGILKGENFSTKYIEKVKFGTKDLVQTAARAKGLTNVAKGIPGVATFISVASNAAELVDPGNKNMGFSEKFGRAIAGFGTDALAIGAGAKIGAAIGSFGGPVGIVVGGAIGGLVGGIASSTIGDKVKDVGGKIGKEIGKGVKSAYKSIKSWFS
ncbi:ribonuclease YeeF family protein [Bacillus sp. T33-2]|uniref:ribonuclease YeeF family protein n=1 Tax=Bacillus sp. T33-2 TaxID=2054168 RepID=UPI000C79395B|nr:LXG domain-containing protein [Bacillus sp. T33-2]PLR92659.1 transposase [Bacillus sp. T33-2]